MSPLQKMKKSEIRYKVGNHIGFKGFAFQTYIMYFSFLKIDILTKKA